MERLNVCICGGGQTGHLYAGVLAELDYVHVSLLTRRAGELRLQLPRAGIRVKLPGGEVLHGRPDVVFDEPSHMVPTADVIILALPGHIRPTALAAIAPFIARDRPVHVGAIPGNAGFDWLAAEALPRNVVIWGMRDAPYTAYDLVPGVSVAAGGGPRHRVFACHEREGNVRAEAVSNILAALFGATFTRANVFLELTLAFGNPVLHIPALYALMGPSSGNPSGRFAHPLGWWRDLTPTGAGLIKACADEQYTLIEAVRARYGWRLASLRPLEDDLLDNYGGYISDSSSLLTMLRTNSAFKGLVPLKRTRDGRQFEIDLTHRIFFEDTHFGLNLLVTLARYLKIDVPTLAAVEAWSARLTDPQFGMSTDYLPADPFQGYSEKSAIAAALN